MGKPTLFIPTEGPCAGHPCDNCRTCRQGRCCRRDNPDYKLPGLGEWDGPIYGELGVLADDGDKVECHCCGEWFVALGHHIRQHDLTTEEYKSIFGLPHHRGLASPQRINHLAEAARIRPGNIERMSQWGQRIAKERTPEQQSDYGKRPKPLACKNALVERMTGTAYAEKLTEAQVLEAFALASRLTVRQIAETLSVSSQTIYNLFAGLSYRRIVRKHGLDLPQLVDGRTGGAVVLGNRTHLTPEIVLSIRRNPPRGRKARADMANRLGVCEATISHILTGRNWGWLKEETAA